jgi:TetR/AcrR family transcriptional repressor of nem operon
MKVTRVKAAENRERIIRTAARLFREKGFDGVGVADLMKSAGLTHGGFYGHFASKNELAATACDNALMKSRERWAAIAEAGGGEALEKMVRSYLSEAHRDKPGSGCALAALGPDAARQDAAIRRSLTEGLKGLVEILEQVLGGRSDADRHQAALAVMAEMVGAVMLSRMVDDEDMSKAILEAATHDLIARDRAKPA